MNPIFIYKTYLIPTDRKEIIMALHFHMEVFTNGSLPALVDEVNEYLHDLDTEKIKLYGFLQYPVYSFWILVEHQD